MLGRVLEGQEAPRPERHHGGDGGEGTERGPGERGRVPPERLWHGEGAHRLQPLHQVLP